MKNKFLSTKGACYNLPYLKVLFALLVCAFLFVLPIILANTFYIDDMNRTTEGYNWHRDGRFMSSTLMHLLSHQVEVVYSLFPFSTILSGFLLALSGFVLSYSLGIRSSFALFFSGAIFLTCPFLIELLIYKFDCLPISLSIVCVVLPFILYEHKIKFFIASFIFLYLVFGFYQTTALSYAIILCVFIIRDVWHEKYQQILINGFLALSSFILAFLYYQYRLEQMGIQMVDAQRSEFIFNHPEFSNLLISRWDGFKDLLFTLLKSSYRSPLYIVCFSVLTGCCYFVYRQKFSLRFTVHVLITLVLVAFICLLAIGVNLVVMEPRWSPRSLIGASFLLLLLFYVVIQLPKKTIIWGYLSFLPLIYYSFLLSSQLGVFLKNQDEYSDFISSMIAPEALKHTDLKLVINGRIQYAPRNSTINNGTMPFIYKLAPLYENYSFYWGIIRMNKFGMFSNTYVFGEERENVISNKESMPIVQQNKLYSLRIDPPYALIEFY